MVDTFLQAVGPDMKMEKGVALTPLDGPPAVPQRGDYRGSPDTRGPKKPYGKKPYEKKSHEKKNYEKKPYRKTSDDKKAHEEKPDAEKPSPAPAPTTSEPKPKPKKKPVTTAPGRGAEKKKKYKGKGVAGKPSGAKPDAARPPRGPAKKLELSSKPREKPAYQYDQQSTVSRRKDGTREEGGFAVLKRKKKPQGKKR